MRTLRERVVHTVLFEALAVAIVTPSVGLITGASLGNAGLLSLLVSGGATVSNFFWTLLFDRWVPTRRRGAWLRAAQAIGLEVIITTFTIPLVLLLTNASLTGAILLDLGGIAFFVAFSIVYNAIFDTVMIRLSARAG